MSESKRVLPPDWDDPDLPELTDEILDVAEYRVGDRVVRPASGYLGPNGVLRGRPPERERTKRQVTLRLDPDVLETFRATGPGWQSRINAALRKAAGL
jgi:uncharacterized protein (DUF4415 family)